jgi:hypothetical protein
MRRGPRQKLDGDGWDWTSKRARRLLGLNMKRGKGKAIKRRMARQPRLAPLDGLGRSVTIPSVYTSHKSTEREITHLSSILFYNWRR